MSCIEFNQYGLLVDINVTADFNHDFHLESLLFFLPFVKPIKVFDEKYFEFNSQNKEIVFFWTKVS
ncbi:hypothetical protein RFL00_11105, partial [Streptococcus suis]|uniref:hypothetical protein n=1 Tax=Streptococcus suis TaxID=1307 RepID=UPI002FCBB7EF